MNGWNCLLGAWVFWVLEFVFWVSVVVFWVSRVPVSIYGTERVWGSYDISCMFTEAHSDCYREPSKRCLKTVPNLNLPNQV